MASMNMDSLADPIGVLPGLTEAFFTWVIPSTHNISLPD